MNSDSENNEQREDNQQKEEQPDSQAPPPLPKKIPEPPGNLRKRADWFRKRSE
jgi:hypothetical protein